MQCAKHFISSLCLLLLCSYRCKGSYSTLSAQRRENEQDWSICSAPPFYLSVNVLTVEGLVLLRHTKINCMLFRNQERSKNRKRFFFPPPLISVFSVGLHIFLKRFYLFLGRGEGSEKEGEKHHCAREISVNCLSHAPSWEPGLQPRHVPWLGIEPAILWFAGWHSAHWAIPARAPLIIFLEALHPYADLSYWLMLARFPFSVLSWHQLLALQVIFAVAAGKDSVEEMSPKSWNNLQLGNLLCVLIQNWYEILKKFGAEFTWIWLDRSIFPCSLT